MSNQESGFKHPHERLNEALAEPAIKAGENKDFRSETAQMIFSNAVVEALKSTKGVMMQDDIKMLAVISVDAAELLISQLVKGKK